MINKTSGVRGIATMWLVALLALAGCGGGGGGGSANNGASPNGTPVGSGPGSAPGTVGGTVSGLTAGSSVTLLNNGGDALTVSADGAFTFASTVASGSPYAVTVQSRTPGTSCSVSNGSGSVATTAVTSVVVNCGTATARTLYAFDRSQGSTDGQYPTGSLVMDTSGVLYGTTQEGGDHGLGTVFKVTLSGTRTIIYSFAGGLTDGSGPQAGLVIDVAGNIYGTTYNDGAFGLGTVFKITPSGVRSWLYSFGGGSAGDGGSPSGSLVMDSSGVLYGTTSGDSTSGFGTVFKITQSGNLTTLYSFASVDPQDGKTPNGKLIVGNDGNLYGTTYAGGANGVGTVFKMTTSGGRIWLYSLGGFAGDGQRPYAGLVADSAGTMYGTTYSGGTQGDGTIFKITQTGAYDILYSFKSGLGDGNTPYGELAIDSGGTLYGTTSASTLLDNFGTVFKLTQAGSFSVLHTFSASPTDGRTPYCGVLIDGTGKIYGATSSDGNDLGTANSGGTVFVIN